MKTASRFIDDEAVVQTDQELSDSDAPESKHQIESDCSSFIDDSEQQSSDDEDTSIRFSRLLPDPKTNSHAPRRGDEDGPVVMMDSEPESDSDSGDAVMNERTREYSSSQLRAKNRKSIFNRQDEETNSLHSDLKHPSSSEASSDQDNDEEYHAEETNMELESANNMDTQMMNCTAPEKQNSILASIQAALASKLDPRRQAALERSVKHVRRGRKRKSDSQNRDLPYADAWALTLTRYDRSFWCSNEARLGNTERFAKAALGYKAVSIHERNNKDMELIYELSVRPKEDTGKEVKWYSQFKIVVGQFVRMCVSTEVISKDNLETLCERGALFKLAALKSVGQIFVDYFRVRGTATTVMNKSRLMKKLCDFALDYGDRRFDADTITRIREMAKLMNCTSNAHKAMYKSEARSNQLAEIRAEQGGWLEPQDFRMIVSKCRAQMQGIIDNFRSIQSDSGRQIDFLDFCKGKESLIQKYNVNFITYLVLIAGGQRPQVYASLRHPSVTDMDDMESNSVKEKLFTIRTDTEKKLRPSDAPYVGFRAEAFPYIKFFIEHIRPAILEMISRNILSGKEFISAGAFRAVGVLSPLTSQDQDHHIMKDENALGLYIERIRLLAHAPLIIHTRNGRAITTKQVTRTVQQCIGAIDPELGNISVMKIRCAFATNAILEHKEAMNEKTADLSADEYIANLAKTMNTSVDMLKNIYITIEPGMIMQSLKNVFSVFQKN